MCLDYISFNYDTEAGSVILEVKYEKLELHYVNQCCIFDLFLEVENTWKDVVQKHLTNELDKQVGFVEVGNELIIIKKEHVTWGQITDSLERIVLVDSSG